MSGNELFNLEEVFAVDDYLYFYAESLTEERSDKEAQALIELLALQPGMHVLDLACGFGRHTNRLAQYGCRMTGVDLSPGFLAIARKDAQMRSVQVEYRQGDMRTIDYQAAFDRVLLLFTAFGYFDDAGNAQVLANAARALKPGGLLCFDSPNRDTIARNFLPYYVIEKEGNLMIDRISFDCEKGLQTNRRIVIRDGVRRDLPYAVRLYNLHETRELLNEAGLVLHQAAGGWTGEPVSFESRRLVIIARKP
jgi:SAM-dependent methyltransferase